MNVDLEGDIAQVKDFARTWNELYAKGEFEKMKELATEGVGIANAAQSCALHSRTSAFRPRTHSPMVRCWLVARAGPAV